MFGWYAGAARADMVTSRPKLEDRQDGMLAGCNVLTDLIAL